MNRRGRRSAACVSACFFALLLFLPVGDAPPRSRAPRAPSQPTGRADAAPAKRPALKIKPAQLETGDLIFRTGRSRESRVVMLFDRGVPYSHVGLVQKTEDGAAYVIHVVPGSAEEGRNLVRREPLAVFLTPEAARAAAVYRPTPPHRHHAEQAAEKAAAYHAARLAFDDDFDAATAEALYCTELVWRAYREAGLDLTGGKLSRRALPFARGAYVLPSTLLRSPHLRKVYASSR